MSTTIGSDDAMLAEGDTLAGARTLSAAAEPHRLLRRSVTVERGRMGRGLPADPPEGTSYTLAGEAVKSVGSSLT
jgi:hypothetical protein